MLYCWDTSPAAQAVIIPVAQANVVSTGSVRFQEISEGTGYVMVDSLYVFSRFRPELDPLLTATLSLFFCSCDLSCGQDHRKTGILTVRHASPFFIGFFCKNF